MTIAETIKYIAPLAKIDIGTIARTIEQNRFKYDLGTEKRIDAFLAQAAHETGGFRTLKEYASGAAYEGRTDLGNTHPGDGVRFKGRGIFQITGRSNYQAVSRHLFGDDRLLNQPELLENPKWAALSGMYYWKSRGLSSLADAGDFAGITKRINGGLNGWADRLSYFEKLKLTVLNTPKRDMAIAIGAAALIALGIFIFVKRKTF